MNNKNPNNKSSIDLKIVCISDTHLLHNYLEVPDGDILIHTGDFGHFRRGGEQTAKEFNQWLGSLNHKIKLIIAGCFFFFYLYRFYFILRKSFFFN